MKHSANSASTDLTEGTSKRLSRHPVFIQMYYLPAPDWQNPHQTGTWVNRKGLATVRIAPEDPFRDSL